MHRPTKKAMRAALLSAAERALKDGNWTDTLYSQPWGGEAYRRYIAGQLTAAPGDWLGWDNKERALALCLAAAICADSPLNQRHLEG